MADEDASQPFCWALKAVPRAAIPAASPHLSAADSAEREQSPPRLTPKHAHSTT